MDMPLQRLTRLSDLIFASSMTILILLFKLPTDTQLSSDEAFKIYLSDSLPSLYLFLVTFVVVAIYWMKDVDQYNHIIKTDSTHMWLQLGSLAFLILLPWTNSLLEINRTNFSVRIIYCTDIFAIGLFSSLAWQYASKNHRLIKENMEEKLIKNISTVNYTEPIIALIAVVAALFAPKFFGVTFILIPILFIVQKKIRTKLKALLAR